MFILCSSSTYSGEDVYLVAINENLGRISGRVSSITVAGTAIGPVAFGFARDLFGSYDLALILLAIVPFSLGIAFLFFGKPTKPTH